MATWDHEQEDPRATAELTSYFTDALQDLGVDGDIDDLTCKKTLCRVNAHFANAAHAYAFEKQAGMVERRRKLVVTATDGVIDVEVYLVRE